MNVERSRSLSGPFSFRSERVDEDRLPRQEVQLPEEA
jgi:hypothetical protein